VAVVLRGGRGSQQKPDGTTLPTRVAVALRSLCIIAAALLTTLILTGARRLALRATSADAPRSSEAVDSAAFARRRKSRGTGVNEHGRGRHERGHATGTAKPCLSGNSRDVSIHYVDRMSTL
jgi:hypothetical protein